MGIIQRIKVNVEGFMFGLKFGQQLAYTNPLITQKEVAVRTLVAWCDHLVDTNRGHLIKNLDAYHSMKSALIEKNNRQSQVVYN